MDLLCLMGADAVLGNVESGRNGNVSDRCLSGVYFSNPLQYFYKLLMPVLLELLLVYVSGKDVMFEYQSSSNKGLTTT